ncbi:MAG TPA: hypothetical protein VMT10_04410 [Solirubrobacteraceae bacterium]|nr:hypothetical protein [Solirubrobacteraceae bacterium]
MHALMRNKKVLAPVIVVIALALAGGAIAYWTSTGTGSGTATVGTTTNLTLTPVTFTGTLYPGGTAATSSIKINNPGASAVQVSNLVLDTAQPTTGNQQLSGIGGLPASGCPATDFTFNANLGSPVSVPAGGSATVTTGTLSMANSTSNQDACKGLTLTIYLKAV